MARIRTFIAVDSGQAVRDRLVALQRQLAEEGAGVKWVDPQNLHFTLLFLGEVDERDLLAVCNAVTEVTRRLPSFSVTVQGTGCFPNMRRPRILWVGLGQGLQEMVALHDALEKPLLELGCYRRENREHTPHITLGRVRGEGPTGNLSAAMTKLRAWKAGECHVAEVQVMSSELGPDGPTYSVLSRGKLTGE